MAAVQNLYMEINAVNAVRHKRFHWKSSFVDKKVDEKNADSVTYLQKK